MRTIEQIQAAIIADVQAQTELASFSSNTSRRAIWRVWTFVQALAILLLEQIIDVFKVENDLKISMAIPGTRAWLTKKVFEFQYSSTNPQIVQLVNLAPKYPVLDESLRIITRCSVVSTISNIVIIKSAKNDPPQALSSPEITSLKAYIDIIGVDGINYICVSSAPDQIYIDCEIYYDGQYSTVIQGTVGNAINTFLATLPFNGELKLSDLEVKIRSVVGVNDVLLKNVKMRSDATPFVSGTFLVQNNAVISRLFPTVAGYVILENSVSNNINYIAS
ncbi:MAG: hypothetical protein H7296_08525 [Bacteroidia bacterium]|nr:hypothetical protein [Bacteroidia bacterium]